MAKTFRQMVTEAKAAVKGISPAEAQHRMQEEGDQVLVVDVRDLEEIQAEGAIPGAINVSLGTLPLRADQELPEQYRDARLQDRSRPVITTCGAGGQAACGAKLLHDMGFTNVVYIEGGFAGWKSAGLPTTDIQKK
jgi:rhodanese-related sulfurtransferase